MGPRLDTGGWLVLSDLHCCSSPGRDFHPARYAGLFPACATEREINYIPVRFYEATSPIMQGECYAKKTKAREKWAYIGKILGELRFRFAKYASRKNGYP